ETGGGYREVERTADLVRGARHAAEEGPAGGGRGGLLGFGGLEQVSQAAAYPHGDGAMTVTGDRLECGYGRPTLGNCWTLVAVSPLIWLLLRVGRRAGHFRLARPSHPLHR